MQNSPTFTIYLLRDPADPTVGYVGQTRIAPSARLRAHLDNATRAPKRRVNAWLLALAEPPSLETLEQCADRVAANTAERRWIAALRADGMTLHNTTRGGQCDYGADHGARIRESHARPEVREKIRRGTKAALSRADVRAKLSAAQRALWQDARHRAKLIASRKEVSARPEIRARRAEVLNDRRRSNPEMAKREAEHLRALAQDPAVNRRRRDKMRDNWKDPSARARRVESQRTAQNRPEVKAKKSLTSSEAAKRRWADPAFRARVAASVKQSWTRPERQRQARDAWADPQRRKERGERISAGLSRPESVAKRREISRVIANRPEQKQVVRETLKRLWADADHRTTRCAAISKSRRRLTREEA